MSNKDSRIGVAVVGLGVGEQHARAYRADARCSLRYVHDLNEAKARQVASSLGGVEVARSYAQILDDPDVQVISLASYDDAHYAQVVEALGRGKHVFVEKPLCRSLEELRVIKKAWTNGGGKVNLVSNLVLRAAPLYRWLKEQLDRGGIGELYAFDGDYLYGRLHQITDGWRKDVKDYSVMAGGGIHLVDLMLWFSGQRPSSVFSIGSRICSRGTFFRYDDFASSIFRFPSGSVGRITANFGCVHRHQHVMRVFGTKATFLYDDAGPRLHMDRNPDVRPETINLSPLPTNKGALIPSFLASICNGDDSGASTQDAFDAVSVCVAADKALRDGVETEIRYI